MIQLFKPKDGKMPKWRYLYDAVKDANYGNFFSFEQLRHISGFDIQNDRGLIYFTNKALLKNDNKMLINVRKEGYKIGQPLEQFAHAKNRKPRARRQIDKGHLELTGMETSMLTPDEQIDHMHYRVFYLESMKLLRKRNISKNKAIKNQKKSIDFIDDVISRLEILEQKIAVS